MAARRGSLGFMRYILPLPLPLTLAASLILPTAAHPGCFDDAMLVFDGSLSMVESGFDINGLPKIVEGRRAVAKVAPEAAQYRQLGLVTYGPGGPTDCYGVRLHFEPLPNAGAAVADAVNALEPDGSTPLAAAVQVAVDALGSGGGTVVVVTDGDDTCGGMPCALAQDLKARGDIRVHVIGFNVRGAFQEWQSLDPNDFFVGESKARCLADITGGEYVGAESLDALIAALRDTISCPLFGFDLGPADQADDSRRRIEKL